MGGAMAELVGEPLENGVREITCRKQVDTLREATRPPRTVIVLNVGCR